LSASIMTGAPPPRKERWRPFASAAGAPRRRPGPRCGTGRPRQLRARESQPGAARRTADRPQAAEDARAAPDDLEIRAALFVERRLDLRVPRSSTPMIDVRGAQVVVSATNSSFNRSASTSSSFCSASRLCDSSACEAQCARGPAQPPADIAPDMNGKQGQRDEGGVDHGRVPFAGRATLRKSAPAAQKDTGLDLLS
jgi:hypothetical protein